LAEYGRGGPWSQGYFKNDQSSWYSNREAMDGMTPLKRLSDWVKREEIFCLVVFDKLPLNRANIDLLLAQCQTLAVADLLRWGFHGSCHRLRYKCLVGALDSL